MTDVKLLEEDDYVIEISPLPSVNENAGDLAKVCDSKHALSLIESKERKPMSLNTNISFDADMAYVKIFSLFSIISFVPYVFMELPYESAYKHKFDLEWESNLKMTFLLIMEKYPKILTKVLNLDLHPLLW